MFLRTILLLLLASVVQSLAQQSNATPVTPPSSLSSSQTAKLSAGIKGSFLVFIDDEANIFVNGESVFRPKLGTSRSKELTIKEGDKLVAQIKNTGGKKNFLLVFESTDGTTLVNFRSSDFRIVSAAGVKNFTADEFSKWTENAKSLKSAKRDKALDKVSKNYSDSVWGELAYSILACTISQKQVSQRPK